MLKLIERIIGSYSDREVRRLKGTVDKIESLEPEMERLSEKELRTRIEAVFENCPEASLLFIEK